MHPPLEIAHAGSVSLTPQVEAEIRDKADGLNRFYPRIMSCRVSIEGPGKHHRKGDYAVNITLAVPGEELVVGQQVNSDLPCAVRDSFHVARRQLEDFARRRRGD